MDGPDTISGVRALEIVYTSILVSTALAITWFACFAVLRLYRGQR